MDKTILISLPVEDLQAIIIDCVNSCLKYNKSKDFQTDQDRWFSLEELQGYIPGNPAKATIYGWVHAREIPHKKFGKRLAFLKSEIDEWLKSKRRRTVSEIREEADSYVPATEGIDQEFKNEKKKTNWK